MARAMAGSALTATHRPRTRGFHGAVDPRTL
ncbi:MAG: permease, partial [Cutibacterium acnes]